MAYSKMEAGLGAVLASILVFLGGWDVLLKALVILVVADYLTGVAAAYFKGQWSSQTGFKGIIRKVIIFVLVGVCATLDPVLGFEDPWIRSAVIAFFIGREGISILENADSLGIPIPQFLRKALQQYSDKVDGTYGR